MFLHVDGVLFADCFALLGFYTLETLDSVEGAQVLVNSWIIVTKCRRVPGRKTINESIGQLGKILKQFGLNINIKSYWFSFIYIN